MVEVQAIGYDGPAEDIYLFSAIAKGKSAGPLRIRLDPAHKLSGVIKGDRPCKKRWEECRRKEEERSGCHESDVWTYTWTGGTDIFDSPLHFMPRLVFALLQGYTCSFIIA